MATWPASLPQNLNVGGFQYSQQDQAIRTEMDAGPAFVRRRFTAAATQFSGVVYVDSTQHATFWTFYNSTINGGVDEFTWTHPIDGTSASVRFVGVPSVTPVQTGVLFALSMQLEILP